METSLKELKGPIAAGIAILVVIYSVFLVGVMQADNFGTLLKNSYNEEIYIEKVLDEGVPHHQGLDGYTEYRILATNTITTRTKEYIISKGWGLDAIGHFREGNTYNATVTEMWNKSCPVIWALEG